MDFVSLQGQSVRALAVRKLQVKRGPAASCMSLKFAAKPDGTSSPRTEESFGHLSLLTVHLSPEFHETQCFHYEFASRNV
jgi:hypothetical protein